MDDELRRAGRGEATDDDALRQAALALRVGDVAGAAMHVRGRVCAGARLPADVLDRFAPTALAAGRFRGLPGQGEQPLGPTVWAGCHALIAAENDVAAPRLLRWELDGAAPARLLELGRWAFTRGLAVDASGARVALHVRRSRKSGWALHDARDGRALGEASSPEPRTELGRWQHAWWHEHVLCATDRGELWVWDLRRAPRAVTRAPELEIADGTILARRRRALQFLATPYAAEPRAEIPLPHDAKLSRRWSGIVPVPGQRALVLDREAGRLSLWSDLGDALGAAALPDLERLKLVAVRPCPAGTVVALRFKSQRRVLLLDLRTDACAWIEAPERPRDLIWSPDGQRLALPSRSGALTVWESGQS